MFFVEHTKYYLSILLRTVLLPDATKPTQTTAWHPLGRPPPPPLAARTKGRCKGCFLHPGAGIDTDQETPLPMSAAIVPLRTRRPRCPRSAPARSPSYVTAGSMMKVYYRFGISNWDVGLMARPIWTCLG